MSTVKRIYTSLKKQTILQSAAIFGNLPVPITLPGTATAYTVTVRKEGRKEGRKKGRKEGNVCI